MEIDSKTLQTTLYQTRMWYVKIVDKQINDTRGKILDNEYVANEEIDSLMDLVKTQTEDSHPGFIDGMLTSTSMISGEAMSRVD